MNRKTVNHNERRNENIARKNTERKENTKNRILEEVQKDSIVNELAKNIITNYKQFKDVNNAQFVNDTYTLCTILVQSKLTKLNKGTYNTKTQQFTDGTYNINNVKMKSELSRLTYCNTSTRYQQYLDELEKLYYTTYNQDGDVVIKCKDKRQALEIEKKYNNLCNSNALDIVHDCYLVLMQYLNNIDIHNVSTSYLLDTFDIVIESSMYYKKSGNKKDEKEYKYTSTNIIKEMSKQCTRSLNDLKSIQVNERNYTDMQLDIYDDTTEEYIHKMLYKHSYTLANVANVDYNGRITTIVCDNEMQNLIEKCIERINFTRTQLYIFKHHICELQSLEEVARGLNMTLRNVEKQLEKMHEKILDCDFLNTSNVHYEKQNNDKKSYKIDCYLANNNEYVATFDSIGKAAAMLKCDKGNISKVLQGKRTQVNGYTFKYTQ